MNQPLPRIGVVIIGINVERYLADCIRSAQYANYPQDLLEIIYVDGGSIDNSPKIARAFDGVKLVELNDHNPTPGRGRNIGWRSLTTPLIQFMDADTILDPLWLVEALPHLKNKTVAVCGHRREIYPSKNLFHLLTDMEWHYEVGPCRYFGGEVLILREALEKTGGFDDSLVAGEDPEFSYRIRQEGFSILRINIPMTTHDINMTTIRQYLKRSFRSGHAYAQIGLRFIKTKEKLWLRELVRIIVRALLPIVILLAGFMTGNVLLCIIFGLLILCRPLFSIPKFKRTFNQSWKHTIIYAVHAALVVYPQFFGALRYVWGEIRGTPLRNKGIEG